jgi:hypothetical protein
MVITYISFICLQICNYGLKAAIGEFYKRGRFWLVAAIHKLGLMSSPPLRGRMEILGIGAAKP